MPKHSITFKDHFQSQMEVLHLHKQLNDELEKFTQCLHESKQQSAFGTLHTDTSYYNITKKIGDLNARIQSLAAIAMENTMQSFSH